MSLQCLEKKIERSSYLIDKAENVATNLKRAWHVASGSDRDYQINGDDALDMITRLKAKFEGEDLSNAQKIQILTLMPSTWSARKIAEVMGSSEYMARVAKQLAEKNGILCMPKANPRYEIPEEVNTSVVNVYQEDEGSMNMPGMKNYVSVRNVESEKEHKQQRLILGTSNEIDEVYRQRFPNCRIGFSKFAMLRPKQCISAGGSGTHTICVCSIHQNVKLMMIGGNLTSLTRNSSQPLSTYSDCLDAIATTYVTYGSYRDSVHT